MSAVRSPWLASLALLLVTLCWGSTFPAMKAVSEQMPAGLMVALRWLLGALALAPFIEWRNQAVWRDASLLALALFASFVLQVLGLTMMSAGRNAFITALNVIMVPLLLPLLGRRLSPLIWVAVVLAGAGIVVMSYEQGGNLLGDLLTFGCALAFAVYVLGMERFAPRHDTLALAGAQAVMMALLAPLWVAAEWWLQGPGYLAHAAGASLVWQELLYLGVICSGMVLFLQTWAQARATAVQAAVIYALEPFFAALFAAWWLGEQFGHRAMLGGGLVIAAMLVSQWPARPTRAAARATA